MHTIRYVYMEKARGGYEESSSIAIIIIVVGGGDVCVCECMHMPCGACSSRRTILWRLFFSSFLMWVLGIIGG